MNEVVRKFRVFTYTGPKGGKVQYLVDDAGSCTKGRCDRTWHRIFDTHGRVYAIRCPLSVTVADAPVIKDSGAEIKVFYGYEYNPPLSWPEGAIKRESPAPLMPSLEDRIIEKVRSDYDDSQEEEYFS